MRARELATAIAVSSAVGVWGHPSLATPAVPIPLEGYEGQFTLKFQNYESFTGTGTIAPGNINYGVFQVQSIIANQNYQSIVAGQTIYSAPTMPSATDPLLVGVFNGITITSITGTPPTEQSVATGGTFELFQSPNVVNFGLGTTAYTTGGCTVVGGLCYDGITNGGNADVLNFDLVPGATALSPSSTLYTQGTFVYPVTGTANGFADITGGADAYQFAQGGYTTAAGTPADFALEDDFCTNGVGSQCTPTIGDWTLRSQDPVMGYAAPEPTSFALLASALVGFGFLRRRRTVKLS